MKQKLWWLFAVALVVVCGVWFLFGGGISSHIEDTNGPDNYSLQTITDQNIRDLDIGAIGSGKSSGSFINGTVYHSKTFSGVDVIHQEDLWTTGLLIRVYDYTIEEGNFRLLVMVDDDILHEFVPNGDPIQTCELGKIDGLFSIRIAGESANYSFRYEIW